MSEGYKKSGEMGIVELPNPLEKLAYTLLADSAGVPTKNSVELG